MVSWSRKFIVGSQIVCREKLSEIPQSTVGLYSTVKLGKPENPTKSAIVVTSLRLYGGVLVLTSQVEKEDYEQRLVKEGIE